MTMWVLWAMGNDRLRPGRARPDGAGIVGNRMSDTLDALADELDDLISEAWAEIYAALDAAGSRTPARMPSDLAKLLHRFDVLAFRLRKVIAP